MFKRMVILGVLSSILLVLLFVLVRAHTAPPVNHTVTSSNSSSSYTTMEYKITGIKGNQYYGKSNNGTGISFSAKSIRSGDQIQVNDVVICYFDKNNLGEGLIKVEKK